MKKLYIIIVVVIIFLLSSFFIYINIEKNKTENNSNQIIEEKIYPKEYSFTLLGTGDALLHNPVYDIALESDGTYNFDGIFTEIDDTILNADLAYINQETVFASPPYSSYPRFNTPSDWGDTLIKYGFDLISLANNHSMDQGEKGALESISYWESKDEVNAVGMASSFEIRDNIKIEEINNIKYAFLSYTFSTNGLPVPKGKEYLANMYSKELAQTHIDSVKNETDIIIVAMHWGTEYTDEPNEYQKDVANELSEMGVDIILGNHPHWMQPIEKINDTIIVYSMGNFISNQMILASNSYYSWSVAMGAFVTMDINKIVSENNEEIYIDNINVELLFHHKENKRYKIIPFDQMNESYHKDYISLYEEHKERMTSLYSEVTVSPLTN